MLQGKPHGKKGFFPSFFVYLGFRIYIKGPCFNANLDWSEFLSLVEDECRTPLSSCMDLKQHSWSLVFISLTSLTCEMVIRK